MLFSVSQPRRQDGEEYRLDRAWVEARMAERFGSLHARVRGFVHGPAAHVALADLEEVLPVFRAHSTEAP